MQKKVTEKIRQDVLVSARAAHFVGRQHSLEET